MVTCQQFMLKPVLICVVKLETAGLGMISMAESVHYIETEYEPDIK